MRKVVKVQSLTRGDRQRTINTPGSKKDGPPKLYWEKHFPVHAAAFQHLGDWRSADACRFMSTDEFFEYPWKWHEERGLSRERFASRIKSRCDHRGKRYSSENKEFEAAVNAKGLRQAGYLISRMQEAGIKPSKGEIKSPGTSSSHATKNNTQTLLEHMTVLEQREFRKKRDRTQTTLMHHDIDTGESQ